MSPVFKFVLILVLIFSTVLVPVSGEKEARAVVVDISNETTYITDPEISEFSFTGYESDLILTKGHSTFTVPIQKIKEININRINDSNDMELITTDGKIYKGSTDNSQNPVKYDDFFIHGDSDFGKFTIASSDIKKAIFYHPILYNFVLDSCEVQNTRAALEDYDYACICASVNGTPVVGSPETKIMGDTGKGFQAIDLKLGPVPIFPDPNKLVIFSFGIANAGHDSSTPSSEITGALSKGVCSLTKAVVVPKEDTERSLAETLILGPLNPLLDVLTADCDGVVAVDKIVTDGKQLAEWTSSGPHSVTKLYPGTETPVGCGQNSNYECTWHVERVSE